MKTVKIESTLQGDSLSFLENCVEVYDFYVDSDGATIEEVKASNLLLKIAIDSWEHNLVELPKLQEILLEQTNLPSLQ